jgi:hypothetical protein
LHLWHYWHKLNAPNATNAKCITKFKKMNNSRYNEPLPKLELDKKRFRVKYCPCGKNNKDGKFVPYVGHENKGYCHSCGETFLPELAKDEQWDKPQLTAYMPRAFILQPKPVSFIPVEIFKASLNLTAFETNHFVQFLINLFGIEVTNELVGRYFIATSKHWNGATVFWQIDIQGKVRTGKIMLYSSSTGKRVKDPFYHINWAHNVLKQPVFELKQCLFGEHLLIDKTKPVAIVESEKTAVIASVYLPQYIWLAVGSLTNLNSKFCNILNGRTVVLFPDLNGFDKWSSKAKELSHLAIFTVSDLLERIATQAERKQGFDIADYLVKYNYKEFLLPEIEATEPLPAFQPLVEVKPFEQPETVYYFTKPEQPKPQSWDQDIAELENYFVGMPLPTQPVNLNKCSTITNCSLFIENHFATVKANNGNRNFLPYLNRLRELKQVLTTNLN